jgi:hypothetical protein
MSVKNSETKDTPPLAVRMGEKKRQVLEDKEVVEARAEESPPAVMFRVARRSLEL